MFNNSSGDSAEPPNHAPQHRTTNAGRLPIARFRLFPFRSPLLRESLLLSLPEGTKMVQFPSFAIVPYGFRHDCQGMTPGGLPHSEIPESKCAYHSSRLIAVSHVLHRLHMPRHPPYAVTCLTHIFNYLTNRLGVASCHCQRTIKIVRDSHSLARQLSVFASCRNRRLGLLRKEVIQPQVPLRLPCYDFTPITTHTFGTFLLLRGWYSDFWYTQLSWCDGRCVQGPGTYSPERADLRLLAIPASGWRVAASHPN